MFEKLKHIRLTKGLSCRHMAEILKLKTRAAYNKKENGNVPFKLEEAKIIATYFDMPIEELFKNENGVHSKD